MEAIGVITVLGILALFITAGVFMTRREKALNEHGMLDVPNKDDGLVSPNMEIKMETTPILDPSEPLHCPVCGSPQVHAGKKGYDAGSGCCGAILIGPLGLLCGAVDSNVVTITCLKCGHSWPAGKPNESKQ